MSNEIVTWLKAQLAKFESAAAPEIKSVQNAEHDVINNVAQPGINSVADQLGTDGMKVVSTAVAAAETTGLSGPDKATMVRKAVENELKADWAAIKPNVLNLAIEFAVAALKAALPAL